MLRESIEVGGIALKNRLVMAPVDLEKSDHGTVTEEQLKYYDERTKGGCFGLVVIEHSFVQPNGRASENQLSSAKDEDIAGLTKLAGLIHGNGCKTVLQISHAGAVSPLAQVTEGISPSGLVSPKKAMVGGAMAPTHAMSQEEIDGLIENFAAAARRAKVAGFDGVEIHAAHGYLLNQFYSPLMNQRTDAYTIKTLDGRLKLHLQVIAAVRKVLGRDLILGMRFGASDYMDGGSTIEDGVQAAKILESAGLSYLSISGGHCGSSPSNKKGVGYFGDSSEAIKQQTTLPIILTGGVKTKEDAESLLQAGKADMIGVARAVIGNPDWARNAMSE